jgi:hypothetical protein
MVADDLNAAFVLRQAMPVMKVEPLGLEGVDHLDVAAQLPVVITCDNHDLATCREIAQQLGRFASRRFIMNQVAKNNEAFRFVFGD